MKKYIYNYYYCIFLILNVFVLKIDSKIINENINIDTIKNVNINFNEILLKINLKNFNKNYLFIEFVQYTSNIEAYVTRQENKISIKKTSQFKLTLNKEKNILIPKNYLDNINNLNLFVFCEKNCNFNIKINSYDFVSLIKDSLISFNGYKKDNKYLFIYKYNESDINNVIIAYSNHNDDFDINVKNININNEETFIENYIKTNNGYLFYFNNNYDKNSSFVIEIISNSETAFINIKIETKNNTKKNINFNDLIFGLFYNSTECFELKENENNSEYYVDFFIYNNEQNLLLLHNYNTILLKYSQTLIISNNYFCLSLLNSQINNNKNKKYFYNFIAYSFEINNYLEIQPQISLIQNSYFYKKKIPSNSLLYYRPSFFVSNINFYLYINVKKGYVNINHVVCETFPYCFYKKIERDNNSKIKSNLINIGSEFFGKIKNENLTSSNFYSIQNLFLVECTEGNEIYNKNFCEISIIFYNILNEINLIPNEKFSFINSKNEFEKLKFNFNFNGLKNNYDKFYNKITIDSYINFGNSYINFLNIDDNYEEIDTYYNENLISNEITIKNSFNLDKYSKKYQFEIINYDYLNNNNFISILITFGNEKEFQMFLWNNNFNLITLSKRITNKTLIFKNFENSFNLNQFKYISFFNVLNCDINIQLNENIKNDGIIKEKINDNFYYYYIYKDFSKVNQYLEYSLELNKINNNDPVCMIFYSGMIIENFSNSLMKQIYINENVKNKICLNKNLFHIINFRYMINNIKNDIIIYFEFDDCIKIENIIYLNNNNLKKVVLFYSNYIFISNIDIQKHCSETNINKDFKICYLDFYLSYEWKNNSKKGTILTISIKSNYNLPTFLNSHILINDLILKNKIQYYYFNIKKDDFGYIKLSNNNNNKNINFFAKIFPNNIIYFEEKEKWLGNILLPTSKDENVLIGKENIIYFDIKDKCDKKKRCKLIIGIENNSNENEIINFNLFYIINNNFNNNEFIIYSFETFEGFFDYNINEYLLKYSIPNFSEKIFYEKICDFCEINFYLNDNNNNIKIKFDEEKLFIENIEKFYNKEIKIFIKFNNKNNNNNNKFYFKIFPFYLNQKIKFSFLNNFPSICYLNCTFLIPFNNFEQNNFIINFNKNIKFNYNIKLFNNYDFEYEIYNKTPKETINFKNINKIIKKENFLEFKIDEKNESFILININILNNEKLFPCFFNLNSNINLKENKNQKNSKEKQNKNFFLYFLIFFVIIFLSIFIYKLIRKYQIHLLYLKLKNQGEIIKKEYLEDNFNKNNYSQKISFFIDSKIDNN